MALTRRQYRALILDTYGIPDEYPPWINSNWVNGRIDRVRRRVAEATECIQGTCAFSAAASTRTYATTIDFIRVDSVEADSNRPLSVTTRDKIRAVHGGTWRGATGVLAQWYEEDYRHLGFCPIPATAGSSLYCYGPRYAAAFTSDTAAGDLPTALDDAVAYGVCTEMARIDPGRGGPRKLALFTQQYNNELRTYRHVRPFSRGGAFVAPRR